jgi:hypothetical protein
MAPTWLSQQALLASEFSTLPAGFISWLPGAAGTPGCVWRLLLSLMRAGGLPPPALLVLPSGDAARHMLATPLLLLAPPLL